MDIDEIPEVTTEEIQEAAEKIVENKAAGLDGIPNEALVVTFNRVSNWFTQAFTACLNGGIFQEK